MKNFFFASIIIVGAFAFSACGTRPPGEFDNNEGKFKRPDIDVIQGHMFRGTPPINPLPCEKKLVVYASHSKPVKDCTGYDGPEDGHSDLCIEAEIRANDAVPNVSCEGTCPKEAWPVIYKGWDCSGGPKSLKATCDVEVELLCWGSKPRSRE